jgi:hypothetical protein
LIASPRSVGAAKLTDGGSGGLIGRVVDAWRLLRPRAIAQTHKRVDDLRIEFAQLHEHLRRIDLTLATLRDQNAVIDARQEECFSSIRQVGAAVEQVEAGVARLELKESQLRAIARRDIELERALASVASLLDDVEIHAHVKRQILAAPISDVPFPHMVVDRLLPDALYEALIRGLPPVELFNDRSPNERQLSVPFRLAPAYGRRVWNYMARTVVERMLMAAFIDRFKPYLNDWFTRSFPAFAGEGLDLVRMHASDGRILLRTRGYVIPPHRDPKWGFLSCLFYLARPGDSESWGTQLYTIDNDEEAIGTGPAWIDGGRCRQVSDVPFLPNRALVFLNSTGAHGARIPDDAPDGLERYAYQFRIGPHSTSTTGLVESLPDERRPFWKAKSSEA